MAQLNSVNIRPGVNVLSVLPHLNYKAWYALAEFVDNAIQSSLDRQRELKATDGADYRLHVDIRFASQENCITIRDNAAGIAASDYQRAFRPAEIPPDASGLSEFGMGMKSAACWFAPNWTVRTTALGENIERTVIFDIDKIVEDSTEELHVISTQVSTEKHYTEIRLDNIRRFPRSKTVQKIKDHLSSIYRIFIRDGSMLLTIDGEPLAYNDPDILIAPSYRDPDGPAIAWKKDIAIDLGDGRAATGFVAIREPASTRLAGLALFRRKRLIMGSFDETYRPEDIFGRSNSFAYQRIFGEIHLKGFHVSHTKDGVKWEEAEEAFLSELRQELSGEDLPLLQQVREHRSKKDVKATRKDAAAALKSMAERLNNQNLTSQTHAGAQDQADPPISEPEPDDIAPFPDLPDADNEHVRFRMRFRREDWVVAVELSYADDGADWLDIRNRPSITDPEPRQITIRLAMLHPFMAQFPTLDSESFTAVLNIAAAMALAEVEAGELADRNPSAVRRFTNEILRNQMSKRLSDGE
ncbi:ATP-binding protein [Hyphobacterium sp. SN044]|uniref:ATP-binding protein n=1 Tax=Hyphobacterium sp. SN044 TaxID=2912575 RepID=UPI001F1FDF42|nr:ATP-binding protein [Hyphobacterium sp. SN044]MCF8880518.1 ATP-binding protein [Hyphobacterium sp. SN044]